MDVGAILLQLTVFTSAAAAIWLINDERPRRRRAGAWIGLLGQPFWIYATIAAAQWGILALSVWYLFCYARGIVASPAAQADTANVDCGADRP